MLIYTYKIKIILFYYIFHITIFISNLYCISQFFFDILYRENTCLFKIYKKTMIENQILIENDNEKNFYIILFQ